jgi:hypothetical protein
MLGTAGPESSANARPGGNQGAVGATPLPRSATQSAGRIHQATSGREDHGKGLRYGPGGSDQLRNVAFGSGAMWATAFNQGKVLQVVL